MKINNKKIEKIIEEREPYLDKIKGGLIGGAALEAEGFAKLIAEALGK